MDFVCFADTLSTRAPPPRERPAGVGTQNDPEAECLQRMPSHVRLKGPQTALRRQRTQQNKVFCPKGWSLIPTLGALFLAIAVCTVGVIMFMEVKISRRSQLKERLREAQLVYEVPRLTVSQSEFFKIHHLLNASAPNVEVSTRLIFNRLYSTYNRKDVLNYYNSVRCRRTSDPASCRNFTVVWKSANRTRWHSMKRCRMYPEGLQGASDFWKMQPIYDEQNEKKAQQTIRPGGWWEPEDCLSGHSVAIIIPYKDRWTHLTVLLNYLHPLLQRQKIRYKIFVVEQYNDDIFNKGLLMNAGFLEVLKEEMFHCFIFHDVDLIPESDHNMYSCPDMPRHLSVAVNEFNYYPLPYFLLVGGVFAIRTEHFFMVNGYSNLYWGWGAEDDDMGHRVLQSGLKITRPLPTVARYTMIKHVKRKRRSDYNFRVRLLSTARKRYRLDGLNSAQYTLIETKEYPWCTNILVDVGRPHPSVVLARGFANRTTSGEPKSLFRHMFKHRPLRGSTQHHRHK